MSDDDDTDRTGGPAFPRDHAGQRVGADGMTLRDYFAGQALACLAYANSADRAAELAYRYADAMLRVRREGHGPTPQEAGIKGRG